MWWNDYTVCHQATSMPSAKILVCLLHLACLKTTAFLFAQMFIWNCAAWKPMIAGLSFRLFSLPSPHVLHLRKAFLKTSGSQKERTDLTCSISNISFAHLSQTKLLLTEPCYSANEWRQRKAIWRFVQQLLTGMATLAAHIDILEAEWREHLVA